jgi:hypothetical protein
MNGQLFHLIVKCMKCGKLSGDTGQSRCKFRRTHRASCGSETTKSKQKKRLIKAEAE